jgi:hypothetical protein
MEPSTTPDDAQEIADSLGGRIVSEFPGDDFLHVIQLPINSAEELSATIELLNADTRVRYVGRNMRFFPDAVEYDLINLRVNSPLKPNTLK